MESNELRGYGSVEWAGIGQPDSERPGGTSAETSEASGFGAPVRRWDSETGRCVATTLEIRKNRAVM